MREYAKQMSEKKGNFSQSVVGTLLFIMNRSIPALETAVGFLTTRVLKSDVGKWENCEGYLGLFIAPSKKKRCFGAMSTD